MSLLNVCSLMFSLLPTLIIYIRTGKHKLPKLTNQCLDISQWATPACCGSHERKRKSVATVCFYFTCLSVSYHQRVPPSIWYLCCCLSSDVQLHFSRKEAATPQSPTGKQLASQLLPPKRNHMMAFTLIIFIFFWKNHITSFFLHLFGTIDVPSVSEQHSTTHSFPVVSVFTETPQDKTQKHKVIKASISSRT